MNQRLSRKTLFRTVGTAGLGLGLVMSGLSAAPRAFAQESDEPGAQMGGDFDPQEMRLRFYQEFTTALAGELGVSNAGDVDPAIRAAWTTVVDGLQSDGLVTVGQATAVKRLIATTEVPVGPGPMFGPGPGRFMRGKPDGDGPDIAEGDEQASTEAVPGPDQLAIGKRLYPDFTAALATELGAGSADEVDGAIRLAMLSVIDTLVADDGMPAMPAEFMKTMVATSDAPLGPGLIFGPPPGEFMHRMHGDDDRGPFGGHDKDGRSGPWSDDDGPDDERGEDSAADAAGEGEGEDAEDAEDASA